MSGDIFLSKKKCTQSKKKTRSGVDWLIRPVAENLFS
jgi:hypothetical protein